MTTRLIPWTPTETTFDICMEILSKRSARIAKGLPHRDLSNELAGYLRGSHELYPITPESVAAIRPLGGRAA